MTIYFLLLGRTSVTCVWENVSSVISVVLVRDSVPTKQSEYQDLEALFPTYSISFLYLLLIIIPEVFVPGALTALMGLKVMTKHTRLKNGLRPNIMDLCQPKES